MGLLLAPHPLNGQRLLNCEKAQVSGVTKGELSGYKPPHMSFREPWVTKNHRIDRMTRCKVDLSIGNHGITLTGLILALPSTPLPSTNV